MAQNPPEGMQRVIPHLVYADAPAAIDFLCEAFGFTERFRVPTEDGGVMHAEVGYEGNVVMLASAMPGMSLSSPKDLPARHAGIMVYVDDVDAHFVRAKAAGATIVAEPEDKHYGDRMYTAADPEGLHWYFATHVKDVPLEEL
ncbi:MAG: VOC family protein [Planctomycetota bacterium]|jgi:uncharacterized glyoxalase superfamily protein PhnB